MNKEAVYALRFVMKDFAQMRKGIETVNKNIEKLQKTSQKTSKNLNNVSTSFGKATRSALKFAAAYFTLSKIITTVFSKANEALQLNQIAVSAGVATDKIGKLGKALRIYGGDAKSAGSAYASLTNIIGGATHGMGISEDVARVNAMYGIGFNYGNISQDTLMTEIAKSMHRLYKQNDTWAINQIASAYGLSGDVAAFLAQHGAGWQSKVSAQKWKQMNMTDAQKLVHQQEELATQMDNLLMGLTPAVVQGVETLNKILAWVEVIAGPTKKTLLGLGETIGKTLYPTQEHIPVGTENKIQYAKGLLEAGKISEEKYFDLLGVLKNEEYLRKGTLTLEEYNAIRAKSGMKPYREDNLTSVQVELLNNSGHDLKTGRVQSKNSGSAPPVSIK